MSISSRASAAAKQFALAAGLGIVVLCAILAGCGFLVAALYIAVAEHFPAAQAASITGAAIIALAILIGLIGAAILRKLKKPQPSMLAEFGSTVGLVTKLAGILVRRDPKKAVILAAVSGAIIEYVMGDRRK